MSLIQFPLTKKNFTELSERYRNDCYGFAVDILRRDWDDWQIEMLKAASDPEEKRIARSAAHGVGKSWVAAAVALWRLVCLFEAQTICTAATFPQLMTRFFPTIKKLATGSIIETWFYITSDSITIPGLENNWIKAQAWNRSNTESFAGLHVHSPALIVDEASAVWEEIYTTFDGSMGHPRSFMLLLGNPLYRTGKLFNAFHKEKAHWNLKSISGYDSRYVSAEWLQEMKDLHGEHSDAFKVRCLGLFPSSDVESWISEDLVLESFKRDIITNLDDYSCNAGLDVAYARDRSCLVIRHGGAMSTCKVWRQREPEDLENDVCQYMTQHGIDRLAIDTLGPGYPLAAALSKKFPGKVTHVQYSQAATNDQLYGNKRAEAWGLTKDWLQYGRLIGDQKDWVEDLASPSYSYDKKGRYMIEPKKSLKSRGISSSDMADALGMSLLLPDTKPVPAGRALGSIRNNHFNGDFSGF